MTTLRALAAAQTTPIRGDVAANLEQHQQLAAAAAAEGAEIVVFPELSLTGYEMASASELAFSEADPRLSPLLDVAAARALTLVVGAPIRLESKLYLGAFIVSPDRTLAIHTKRRLSGFTAEDCPGEIVPPSESSVFEPGSLAPLVRCRGAVAAVGICAESLRRTPVRDAAERGANTYLTGHFSIPRDVEFRHTVLRTHAQTHQMAIVFACYAGHTAGLRASGCSAIFSPEGERLVSLGPSGAGVAIAIESADGWRCQTVT